MTATAARRRLAALSLVMLPALAMLAITPTNAAVARCGASWTVVTSSNLTGGNFLSGVSAIGNGDVWAVGYHVPANYVQTLAEHWNGTSWAAVSTPNRTTKDTGFNAVSMATRSDGWAVGYAVPGNTDVTMAEHWDGTAWSLVPTPNLGTKNNLLVDVDSVSSTDAWSVGFGSQSSTLTRRTLAEHWDGLAWSIVPTPNAGSTDNQLLAVAAASSKAVWAVGYAATTTGYKPLTERYDGTRWSVVPASRPSGDGVLDAVAVAGSGDVWAAGYRRNTGQYRALLEHWDGKTWSQVAVPNIGGTVEVVRDLVVASRTDIWAAGTYFSNSAGGFRGFTLHWDGTAWTVVPAAVPASGAAQPRSIDRVASTGQLWIVGGTKGKTLAEYMCPAADPLANDAPHSAESLSGQAAIAPAATGGLEAKTVQAVVPRVASSAIAVTAVDEATTAGIAEITTTYSAAVADYNNDGWPDFLLSRHANTGRLYLNNQQGGFIETDVGTFALMDRHYCIAADVNGDGARDIFCSIGADRGSGLKANTLYVQGPNTTFGDVAASYGVLDPTGRGRVSAAIDANGDGLPDLFVGNSPVRPDGLPSPNRLFINTGAAFRYAPGYGLDQSIGAVCAQAADYNRDGHQDLLVCPEVGNVHLYQNISGSSFIDVTAQAGLPPVHASSAVFTDMNGDGLLDLVMTTSTKLLVFTQNTGSAAGTFSQSFSYTLTAGVGVAAGDVNGDGLPDLYALQGAIGTTNVPDLMLTNNGTGTSFTPRPIPETNVGAGDRVYALDYDHNGLMDFLVLNGRGLAGPVQLIAFFPASQTPSRPGERIPAGSNERFRRL